MHEYKLNDLLTSPKTYWSILKRFLNNRKIPALLPVLVNVDIITNFPEKPNLFHKICADQCTPLNNLNKLPLLYLKTDKKMCNLSINKNDASVIIRNLDPNKSHGWDNLSVRMTKLCGDSLIFPLKCIFERAHQEDKYPDCWEKAFVVPVHQKKGSKSLIKNYRPVSLLSSLGKTFEILIKNLFNHFCCNNLFPKNKFGFMRGDSCIFQLLSIFHKINSSLDCNPTIESYGIGGEQLNLLKDYLQERQQRVVLNGQSPSWEAIKSVQYLVLFYFYYI